jgi:Protein NO VEIN, C-terminal
LLVRCTLTLLDDEPDDIVVAWWDRVTGLVRLEGERQKQERSRRAERLSYEKEKKRLRQLGINLNPVWMGLEDNTAGYDILSYEPGDPAPTNVLIEVKSTIASPLRFILSRFEWDKAKSIGDAYCFHIWDMQREPPALYVRTVDSVARHIPADSEKGKWKTVEIPVSI